VIAGVVLVVRGWVRIYFARGGLTTDGVYRITRHPQYTGLFLAIFGQLIHWPTIPTLVLAPIIVWLYVRLASREERRMEEKFGAAYAEYRQRVPMFLPRLSAFQELFPTS